MLYSVFSLHHSFACKVLKGDLFISQSDNKERKQVMYLVLNDKETVKLETFCLDSINSNLYSILLIVLAESKNFVQKSPSLRQSLGYVPNQSLFSQASIYIKDRWVNLKQRCLHQERLPLKDNMRSLTRILASLSIYSRDKT